MQRMKSFEWKTTTSVENDKHNFFKNKFFEKKKYFVVTVPPIPYFIFFFHFSHQRIDNEKELKYPRPTSNIFFFCFIQLFFFLL